MDKKKIKHICTVVCLHNENIKKLEVIRTDVLGTQHHLLVSFHFQSINLNCVVQKHNKETYMLMLSCQFFQRLFGSQLHFSQCQKSAVESEKKSCFV